MKKLKICYVMPHFYPHIGGGEQAFLDTIYNLKKYFDIEARVITSSSGGIVGKHEHLKIPIYSYKWKMFCGHPLVNKKDLEEHINWADIVHVGVYSPVIPTVKMCKKLNKPVIVTAHESLNEKWYWVESNKLKALAFRIYEKLNISVKCECFHVPSDATKKDLIKNNKKANVKRIYWISDNKIEKNKINKKDFYKAFNITKNDKTFLYYGRPGQTKGIFVYEDAINIVKEKLNKEQLKNTKFCFIVSKDPKKGLVKFIKYLKENNLENLIKYRTDIKRKEMLQFIECADYVVVPSITEGFGLSAIEACERNKKLIHSNGGSLPEVTYGKCLEFENRDVLDLSNILLNTINNKAKFINKKKKDFSTETIVNEFYQMYNDVVKEYEKQNSQR